MSGGGKSVRRGGMRLANSRAGAPVVSSEDDSEKLMEQLDKECEKIQELLQECRKRRREIKDEFRALTKTAKSLENKLPKLKLEINGCDTTRKELTKLIPDLRVQCKVSDEDEQKRAELQDNVEKCRSDMVSCAKLADKLEAEFSKLQKGILDAGGPRLKKQKAACEKVVADLNAAEKSLNSSKVEVTSSEKAEAKAKAALAELEKELEECQKFLEGKEVEFKSLETGALEVMTAYEQVKVIEADKRTALESASKEAEDLKNSQSKIKCVEIDLLGQLEALDKQISDCQKKKHHWEKEIARLREVEDEYDFGGEEEEVEEEQPETLEADDMDVDTPTEEERTEDSDKQQEAEKSGSKSFSLLSLSHSVLEKYDPEDIKETIGTLEAERNLLAKNANMGAITEYRKKETDYLSRYVEFASYGARLWQMSQISPLLFLQSLRA
jgi:structural maintenance of chromosome 4